MVDRKRNQIYMAKTNSAAHMRVVEETPAYWKVVFDYPPFNIVDGSMFEALQELLQANRKGQQ